MVVTTLEQRRAYDRDRRRRRVPAKVLDYRYSDMHRRSRRPKGHDTPHVRGCPLVPRAEFMAWAKLEIGFVARWIAWRNRGFPKDLAPSVDRIDVTRGYELDNIRWVTWSENQAKRHQDNLRRSEAQYE